MNHKSHVTVYGHLPWPTAWVSLIIVSTLFTYQSATAQNNRPNPPEVGTYKSSMMTSWLTVTSYGPGDPRKGTTYGPQVDYGVGSMPMKGLFGDLILHRDGTYTFTADKHGGTWKYDAQKNTVVFTGWLQPFKTHYDGSNEWLTIYTGDVKMPDGGTLNIRYRKQRSK